MPLSQIKKTAKNRVRIATFNIRLPVPADGRDSWDNRKHAVASLLSEIDPHVAGLQEAHLEQLEYLASAMPGFEWFGPTREGTEPKGERCPLLYDSRKVKLANAGIFWLSRWPDRPGSKSWFAAAPRVVTWGEFKNRAGGRRFYVFNTHLDHWSRRARTKGAKLMVEMTEAISKGKPSIITGDLNAKDNSDAYSNITSDFEDSRNISEARPSGPWGTYRSFNPESRPRARIDYVFVSPGIRVIEYKALTNTYDDKKRPSDHMPVTVELDLSSAPHALIRSLGLETPKQG